MPKETYVYGFSNFRDGMSTIRQINPVAQTIEAALNVPISARELLTYDDRLVIQMTLSNHALRFGHVTGEWCKSSLNELNYCTTMGCRFGWKRFGGKYIFYVRMDRFTIPPYRVQINLQLHKMGWTPHTPLEATLKFQFAAI